MIVTSPDRHEEGRKTVILRQLQGSEQSHECTYMSCAKDPNDRSRAPGILLLYDAVCLQWMLESLALRWVLEEDDFRFLVRHVSIGGHASHFYQRSSDLPKAY